jgi:hypothetical protein
MPGFTRTTRHDGPPSRLASSPNRSRAGCPTWTKAPAGATPGSAFSTVEAASGSCACPAPPRATRHTITAAPKTHRQALDHVRRVGQSGGGLRPPAPAVEALAHPRNGMRSGIETDEEFLRKAPTHLLSAPPLPDPAKLIVTVPLRVVHLCIWGRPTTFCPGEWTNDQVIDAETT